MRRLCLFSFYDPDGVVDNYVIYLLKSLRKVSCQIYIAVNGSISRQGLQDLTNYADKVIKRPNVGFDAGAYKDMLCNHIGWDNLKQYDELILCNNTFFGPFISLERIIQEMEYNYDFWGLNKTENTVVDYIQSYFLVMNLRILSSEDLYYFFEKYIDESDESLLNVDVEFEIGMTFFMQNRRYRIGAYGAGNTCYNYRSPNIAMRKYHRQFNVNQVLTYE